MASKRTWLAVLGLLAVLIIAAAFVSLDPRYSRMTAGWFHYMGTLSSASVELRDATFLLTPENGSALYTKGGIDFSWGPDKQTAITGYAALPEGEAWIEKDVEKGFVVRVGDETVYVSELPLQSLTASPDGRQLALIRAVAEDDRDIVVIDVLSKESSVIGRGTGVAFLANGIVARFTPSGIVAHDLVLGETSGKYPLALGRFIVPLAQSEDRTLIAWQEFERPYIVVYRVRSIFPELELEAVRSMPLTFPERLAALSLHAVYTVDHAGAGALTVHEHPLDGADAKAYRFPRSLGASSLHL